MRSFSRPFTNIIFATQRRKAVKSLTEVQTFLISLPKNLFTGSRLEICLSGQPENFPVMHHVKSVGFGIPAVTVGCPGIGPFIVRTPYPRAHKFKNSKIQKFKNSKIQKGSKETQNYKLTFYSHNYFATFPLFEKLP